MRMSPASGDSSPASRRSVVVLPHPDGPSREKNSPRRSSKDTPSTARVAPKRLETSRNSTLDTERKRRTGRAFGKSLGSGRRGFPMDRREALRWLGTAALAPLLPVSAGERWTLGQQLHQRLELG